MQVAESTSVYAEYFASEKRWLNGVLLGTEGERTKSDNERSEGGETTGRGWVRFEKQR